MRISCRTRITAAAAIAHNRIQREDFPPPDSSSKAAFADAADFAAVGYAIFVVAYEQQINESNFPEWEFIRSAESVYTGPKLLQIYWMEFPESPTSTMLQETFSKVTKISLNEACSMIQPLHSCGAAIYMHIHISACRSNPLLHR